MLKIFDSHKKSVGVFDDDNAFLRFIRDQENQKLLNPTVGMVYWSFSHYLPSQFKNLCAWVKPEFLTLPQLRALEKGLGLVEICRGDYRKIQEIPVTGDVDVEDLKKKFSRDYCGYRRWLLIETQEHKPPHKIFVNLPRYCHSPGRKSLLSQKSLDTREGQRLKSELDSCIDRLRQKASTEEPASPTNQNHTQKERY